MICPMDHEHDDFFAPPTKEKSTMSLEQALVENTEAMKALTIALASHHIPAKAAATTTGPAAPLKVVPAAAKPAGGALDYEKDIKPLVLQVASKKGRDKTKEVLAQFGVENANQLKAEQFSTFITACNTALAAK